jgi:hypothetical protein
MEVHPVEIRLYGKDLPRRLYTPTVSNSRIIINRNKGIITSTNSKNRWMLRMLLGEDKSRLRLLPNIRMDMDTTNQFTHPLPLLPGNRLV